MRYRIGLVVLSLLLSATLLNGQDLLLQNGDVVVTLGNSITELGEGPTGYVDLMRKSLSVLYPERRIYFINAGISGHKSTDMAERFQRDVLDQRRGQRRLARLSRQGA